MLPNTLRVRLHGLLNKTLKAVIQIQEDPRDPRGLSQLFRSLIKLPLK